MSLLGYEPSKYYTGRGPLEAAALEVRWRTETRFSAPRWSLRTAKRDRLLVRACFDRRGPRVIALVSDKLGSRLFAFFPGVSYRHILRVTDGSVNLQTTPPHDIQGKPLTPYLPTGDMESA
jgi:2,3-bisphosphoglycerate-independent phosphoglycerate mutase